MLYTFLLVVQGIIAAALIGVILMQKSEGGGLGVGGSPAGFLSARGAADFLTRATAILATLFVGMCVLLAVLASVDHATKQVDTDAISKMAPPVSTPLQPATPLVPGAPLTGAPLTGAPAATGTDPLATVPADAAGPAAAAPAVPAPADKGVPFQR